MQVPTNMYLYEPWVIFVITVYNIVYKTKQ